MTKLCIKSRNKKHEWSLLQEERTGFYAVYVLFLQFDTFYTRNHKLTEVIFLPLVTECLYFYSYIIYLCFFLWHSSRLYGYKVTQNCRALIECWSGMLLRPVMFYFYIGMSRALGGSLTNPGSKNRHCTHTCQYLFKLAWWERVISGPRLYSSLCFSGPGKGTGEIQCTLSFLIITDWWWDHFGFKDGKEVDMCNACYLIKVNNAKNPHKLIASTNRL